MSRPYCHVLASVPDRLAWRSTARVASGRRGRITQPGVIPPSRGVCRDRLAMMVCQSGWTGRLTPGRTRRVCGITGWVDFERDLTGCLPRLNDMFTFAVWDSAIQELVLARDRLGVKPLSFAQTAYGTLFGSEPKAILAHPQWRAELD